MTFTRGEETMAIDAIRLWGKDAQTIKCIEELSELIKALCKESFEFRRNNIELHEEDINKIIEEYADVEIMMNQIRIVFGTELGGDWETFYNKVQGVKSKKLDRLQLMLWEAEEERVKKIKKHGEE